MKRILNLDRLRLRGPARRTGSQITQELRSKDNVAAETIRYLIENTGAQDCTSFNRTDRVKLCVNVILDREEKSLKPYQESVRSQITND